MNHLWEEYHNPNQLEEAIIAFSKLTMKAGEEFDKFKNDFIRLAGESHKAKPDWLQEIWLRLPSYLKLSLATTYHRPGISFEEFAREASKLALVHKQAYKTRAKTRTNSGGPGGNSNNRTSTINRNTAATASPRTNNTSSPANTSTPGTRGKRRFPTRHSAEKIRQLIAEGKCFNCEKPGHITPNCPDRKTMTPDRIQALVNRYATGESAKEEIDVEETPSKKQGN